MKKLGLSFMSCSCHIYVTCRCRHVLHFLLLFNSSKLSDHLPRARSFTSPWKSIPDRHNVCTHGADSQIMKREWKLGNFISTNYWYFLYRGRCKVLRDLIKQSSGFKNIISVPYHGALHKLFPLLGRNA